MSASCQPVSPAPDRAGRPTIGEIFRRFGDDFAATYPLSGPQHKVLRDIQRCRTPALGGHIEQCDHCGFAHLCLHSCRNRHCPTCQCLAQKTWLEQRLQRVLPIPYFHVVFTLPEQLRPLCRSHPAPLFNALFAAASQTLLTFGRDPAHLGALLGITAVLHTWTRTLLFHPHLHCIVTAGGLCDDGTRWVPKSPRFLFPVRALSRVFRGKFLDALQDLFDQGHLPSLSATALSSLRGSLPQVDWNVYSKPPFGGAEALYRYLGRYTHRTGISNQRLVSADSQRVTFRTRGSDTCSLTPMEFIRRFLLHVLPHQFVKVRHFGLLASGHVKGRLEQARRLLLPTPTPVAPLAPAPVPHPVGPPAPILASALAPPIEPAGAIADPRSLCPRCQRGSMRRVSSLHELIGALVAFFRALASWGGDTS